MSAHLSRRELLIAALAATAAPVWPLSSRAEGRPPLGPSLLAPDLLLLSGAGANITILKGPRGALLVDGGLANRTDEVLRIVKAFTGSPKVELLFDTSWRPEHVGANAELEAAGATILAHDNTKRWMAADFEVPWEHRKHSAQPAAALPSKTFDADASIEFAGRSIAYGPLPPAHTNGDIYVRFPKANVLAVGEALAVGRYPVPDYVTGGWIGGFVQATRQLLEMADSKTRIVPSDGAAQGREALEAQLKLCTAALEAVRDAYKRGRSLKEFIAAKPMAAFHAERGDPALFLRLVYEGTRSHLDELSDL
ncbi:MAG TPA: MBL fold metallo-hydrolase [Gammaproteobacteria bacterium]|nr:MBL fold metallo-hydrolase [Gammaproteobacteria bacterium]